MARLELWPHFSPCYLQNPGLRFRERNLKTGGGCGIPDTSHPQNRSIHLFQTASSWAASLSLSLSPPPLSLPPQPVLEWTGTGAPSFFSCLIFCVYVCAENHQASTASFFLLHQPFGGADVLERRRTRGWVELTSSKMPSPTGHDPQDALYGSKFS